MSNYYRNIIQTFKPEPEAEALFARMAVQPTLGYKIEANNLIKFLKTASNWQNGNLWDRIDQLFVFAGANTIANSLLNWKANIRNATNTNSWFVPDGLLTGYTLNSFINTNYNPITHRVNLQLTNGGFGYGARRIGRTQYDFGSFEGNNFTGFSQNATGGNAFGGIGNTVINLGANTMSRANIVLSRSTNTLSAFKNGALLNSSVTVTPQNFTNRNLFIGGYNTGNIITRNNYQVYSYYFSSNSITATEAATLNTLMNNFVNNIMQYSGSAHKIVVCDGNSLTAGVGATLATSYPSQLNLPDWEIVNIGIGSQRTISMTAKAPIEVDLNFYNSKHEKGIVVAWEIINDLLFVSAAQAYANFVTYCQARKAAGWKVIVCTLIAHPTISPASLTFCNDQIRANYLTFADGIVDLAADPRFQNVNDLTYYDPGRIHLNATGYGVVASLVRPVILSI
ncbi:hypothetical protein [Leptolyngbya phage Lbo-JY46]